MLYNPPKFLWDRPAGYVRAWLHCKKSKVTAVTRFMGGTKLGSACQKPRSRVGTADIRLWVCSVKSRSLVWRMDIGIERQLIQKKGFLASLQNQVWKLTLTRLRANSILYFCCPHFDPPLPPNKVVWWALKVMAELANLGSQDGGTTNFGEAWFPTMKSESEFQTAKRESELSKKEKWKWVEINEK